MIKFTILSLTKPLSLSTLAILDESSGESGSGSGSGSSGSESESSDEAEGEEGEKELIIDQTETNLVILRRTIYLTIQSSLDFEECAHKLLKMDLKAGQEVSKTGIDK